MSAEQVFSIASTTALAAWLLLVFVPRWRWTEYITGLVVPLAFAVIYLTIVAVNIAASSGDFQSLAGVAALFADPWVLLGGWIHYLAFDLLVGTWEVRDATSRGIPHWVVVPCLVLTFLLGPIGWLLYQGVRGYKMTA